MNILIDYIKDAGALDKERIVFRVCKDEQLGKFIVAESRTLQETRFSSKIKNPYWFPDQEVKEGDRVVLYTKVGRDNIVENEDGSHTYFYYWGLASSHLSEENPCVVLFEASWSVSVIPKD